MGQGPGDGWGGGYVTDVEYHQGYHGEQSPTLLRLACLLCGVATEVPAEGAHYLDLGCGPGLGALVVAASNPSWRVTGIDFNPAHVAAARAIAREAGLENVAFLEADLARFAESAAGTALPEADIVTLHGVWSWVAPPVRAGIQRLLLAKLRAGGIAHVSYNALPGWQGMLAVQRLVREAGRQGGGRSDRQAQAGLATLRDLAATGPAALGMDARLPGLLAEMGRQSGAGLAHEFVNAHWSPCWHADVAAAMAEARLDWVGSASLLDNFAELTMTPAQLAVCDRFEDPLLRELVKDICLARTLRHDVYVRGARRLTAGARDAALGDLVLALGVPPGRVQLAVEVAAGRAELSSAVYGPVTATLGRGPSRLRDLLRAPGPGAAQASAAELAGVLVGTRQAIPLARPGAPPGEPALRLNAVLAERLAVAANLGRTVALASPALGAGLPCSIPELFLAGRTLAGAAAEEAASWAERLGAGLDAAAHGHMAGLLRRGQEEALPLMRALGALPD